MKKTDFLKWLNDKYPKLILSKTQIEMLDVIFLGNSSKNFARQVGKSTIIELIREWHSFLLADCLFNANYDRLKITLERFK